MISPLVLPLLLACGAAAAAPPLSIDAFGAVAGADTLAAALANGRAFAAALAAANVSGAGSAVLVPGGSVYAYLPAVPQFEGLAGVTILLEGALQLYTANFSQNWPGFAQRAPFIPFRFAGCAGLRIVSAGGAGRIDGRGTAWWWQVILGGRETRPRAVLEVDGAVGLEVANVTLTNAPQFHINVEAARGALVHGVTVLVHLEDQLDVYRYVAALEEEAAGGAAAPATTERERTARVLRAAGRIGPTSPAHEREAAALARRAPAEVLAARRRLLPAGLSSEPWFDEAWRIDPPIPMIYALNTDGIDVAGEDITVRNCTVTNFDDTVCAKPQLGCTRNLLVEDITIFWGCGLSMGSVPPDVGNNCISGALVRRVTFNSPLKAVYIKPNPAKVAGATGEISNITYQDLTVNEPVWWPIWLGTQQQHQVRAAPRGASTRAPAIALAHSLRPSPPLPPQPGYNGTGCSFLYPLDNTTCPTDPEVSVFNITLQRVYVIDGPSPGILLANASNPATGVVFEDVVHENSNGFPVGTGYLCTAVVGVARGSTAPVPTCFADETDAALLARRQAPSEGAATSASPPAPASAQPFSIEAFGAVAGIDTRDQALANGRALAQAIAAANASAAPDQRAVLVPGGKVYAYLPAAPQFEGLVGVTIFLEGTLNLTTANFSAPAPGGYPGYSSGSPWPPLAFAGCAGLRIVSALGTGLVNGRGNEWWWATIFFGSARPNLLVCNGCSDLELGNVSFLNGPQFHVAISNVERALVYGVTVMVDIEDQLGVYRYIAALEDEDEDGSAAAWGADEPARVGRALRAAGRIGPTSPAHEREAAALARRAPAEVLAARRRLLPARLSAHSWFDEAWRVTPPFPMIYALNTDGIDISGADIVVRNCSITNFDDTVCPKPQLGCTRNFLIEDIDVTYGVGVSMGSVPPDVGNNCISGVLARRLHFSTPLKAIYLKPNPAKSDPRAAGEISNITYTDVVIVAPIWWPIWLGTQQQQQPGSSGTGCSFLYPLDNTTCPTDPQVSVFNITLRNVAVFNGNSPGVLLMNASNPATGVVFDNVVHHNSSGWPVGADYLVANVQGVATGGTFPVPPGFVVRGESERA